MRRLAAVAALTIAGCGSPSADLFDVTRTGRDENANVRLVVSDGGSVRCNDGSSKALDSDRLLAARELARDLVPQAELGIELPPEPNSTLRYRVRMEAGEVAFSDTSRERPPTFNRLVAFVADVTENVCKLER